MRAVIWAAVSSRPQATPEKDSIPVQLNSARDRINAESWDEAHEPLIIPGHSRSYLFLTDAATEIPQYHTLMELARNKAIDLLICRSYDRLGRTDALVSQVLGYLRHHSVQTLALDMPAQIVDPAEYDGSLDRGSIWTSAIGRARAEDEVAELRRRHKFGMRARTRRGLHPGKPPYGYRKTKQGMVIDESEAETVRLMFQWFLEGMAARVISSRLAGMGIIRSERGIAYMLRNPYYSGLATYSRTDGHGQVRPRADWLLAEGQHEAIIDRPTWEEVQDELARRGANVRYPYTRYPLSGIVICGYCNRPMRIRVTFTEKTTYRYYACGKPDCHTNSIKAEQLEDDVAEWVWSQFSDESILAAIEELVADAHENDGTDERLRAAQDRVIAALDKYQRDYEYGLLGRGEYYANKTRLEDQLGNLTDQLAKLDERRIDPERIKANLDFLVGLADQGNADDWRDQGKVLSVKAALRRAGLRVTVADGNSDITLLA